MRRRQSQCVTGVRTKPGCDKPLRLSGAHLLQSNLSILTHTRTIQNHAEDAGPPQSPQPDLLCCADTGQVQGFMFL